MDTTPEEKTCPLCGRPNLPKATKCWYCQAPLDEEKDIKQDTLLATDDIAPAKTKQSHQKQSTEAKESEKASAPEWLQRVRELIEAEKQDDEIDESWQQEHLFSSSYKEEKDQNKPLSDHGESQPDQMIEKEIPDSDDLPDGFTQFTDK